MPANVAIVGMGATGVSTARFFIRHGIIPTCFDEKACQLPEDLALKPTVGPLTADKLRAFELVVVSPGVAWNHPALVAARAAGVRMCGDLALFAEHFHGALLAVTGTNGKTTTVSIIKTLLEVLPGGIEAGGNIGTPMLDLLLQEPPPTRVVLELSSFQLERSPAIHPRWAVLLNLQPDHADAHRSPAEYMEAKLRLFAKQAVGDTAMLPLEATWHETAAELKARGVRVRRFGVVNDAESADAGIVVNDSARLFWHQDGRLATLACADLHVRGRHQQLNLAVAAQAAADFGVSAGVIREGLTAFRGLPHRLMSLGMHDGREWYDDSKATNPDAAAAALSTFDRVLWICGGLTKGLDVMPLADVVRNHVAYAFIIGKDTKPFAAMLKAAGVPYREVGKLERAVALCRRHASTLPVLLSPAAASQDQYKNYAERGAAFANAVLQKDKAV